MNDFSKILPPQALYRIFEQFNKLEHEGVPTKVQHIFLGIADFLYVAVGGVFVGAVTALLVSITTK